MTQADFPETPGRTPEPSSNDASETTPKPAESAAPAESSEPAASAAPHAAPAAPDPTAVPEVVSAEQLAAEEAAAALEAASGESSFGDILSEFEDAHQSGGGTMQGTVVSVTPDGIFVDLGRKTDGVLPADPNTELQPGDEITVSIRGRDAEGNMLLSTVKVETPKDWSGLEAAFANKETIAGTVSGVIKGGLSVDIGVRAFMPASRSGVREMADMEKLVGEEIECRITKLDTAKEDVVVDRRVVLEERAQQERDEAFARLEPGTVVKGRVRTLTDFGAFVDLGGVDGLLHVSDMSYARGVKPSDVVSVDQEIEVKILKLDPGKRKISLGLKQLQPDPWTVAAQKYQQGAKVQGSVVRLADFGAFVQLEPGLDGLIHVSEMSWTKRNVKPSDVVSVGDNVEVVVLNVDPAKKRIALGLKQALGDPWADAVKKYPVGSVVEAPVTSLAQFGAFVDLGDGIEGMIHIGDITNERRLNHPNEVLTMGQTVKAKVTEADKGRRRMRLSMKQLEPTTADEFIADKNIGDEVTGRVASVAKGRIKVELDEGVTGFAPVPEKEEKATAASGSVDITALSAMLSEKWKSGGGGDSERDNVRPGQVRSFKIIALDPENRRIDLELVS